VIKEQMILAYYFPLSSINGL